MRVDATPPEGRLIASRCVWCSRPIHTVGHDLCVRCRVIEGIERVHPSPAPGSYRVVPPEFEAGPAGTGDAALAAGVAGGAR